MSSGEEWRPVPSLGGLYEVSSLGRVRSVGRTVVQTTRWGGLMSRQVRPKMLSPENSQRYTRVIVSVDGKPSMRFVHLLILEVFAGPRPLGMQARHLNGLARDNRPENLRWGSAKENGEDKVRHGTSPRGEKNIKAKLTHETVVAMRADRRAGMTTAALGKKYGVSQPQASAVCLRKSWSFIQGE